MYASQEPSGSLRDSVEDQIRAFGDSIDQNKADGNAATALAKHGITGSGKTLKVGKSHALTAALFNSELLQSALIDTCTDAIQYMERFSLSSVPWIMGNVVWDEADSFYYSEVYTSSVRDYENKDFSLTRVQPYSGKLNSYDESLLWMAANTATKMEIKRVELTEARAVYQVSCTIIDKFDFSTSSGDGFKDLISGFGALLFNEFKWEASVSFQLTVPRDLLSDYLCTHGPQMYRWTYDPATKTMTSDASGNYAENGVTRHAYKDTGTYYYELDKPIRLFHNEPWVLEYDIKNPGTFVFAPLNTEYSFSHISLLNNGRSQLWLRNRENVTVSSSIVNKYNLSGDSQYILHNYGLTLNKLFTYNTQNVYTLCLENEVHADGSNMVYLTVHNKDTGELLLDRAPMDDYTRYESWIKEYVLKDETDQWISGKDLYINFIGNKSYRFSAKYFELRVWEGGMDAETDYYQTKVTKPTCTEKGYTTYTCTHCGYSYQSDKVKATGHSYGEWTTVTAATCTESGEEQRKCKNCDVSESRAIEATGHSYENHICINCGDRDYIPGDVDLSGTVDVEDVLALLWNVLFPDDYPIEVDADFDGNGTTDVDDVLTLLWHVLFPEDYPLGA